MGGVESGKWGVGNGEWGVEKIFRELRLVAPWQRIGIEI